MFATYTDYAIDLAVDLVAIFVMAYAAVLPPAPARRPAARLRHAQHRHFRGDVPAEPRASGHRPRLRTVRHPVDHPAAVQHGDPAGGGLLLRRPGHGVGQRDEPERPLAGRRGERAAAADHVRGGQPPAARPRPAHGDHPGRGARRRRRADRRPGEPAQRTGHPPRRSTRSTTSATPWSSTCATGPVRARSPYDQAQYDQAQYDQQQYAPSSRPAPVRPAGQVSTASISSRRSSTASPSTASRRRPAMSGHLRSAATAGWPRSPPPPSGRWPPPPRWSPRSAWTS